MTHKQFLNTLRFLNKEIEEIEDNLHINSKSTIRYQLSEIANTFLFLIDEIPDKGGDQAKVLNAK